MRDPILAKVNAVNDSRTPSVRRTSRVVIDQLVSATESFHTGNELNRDYYQKKKPVAPIGFLLTVKS